MGNKKRSKFTLPKRRDPFWGMVPLPKIHGKDPKKEERREEKLVARNLEGVIPDDEPIEDLFPF